MREALKLALEALENAIAVRNGEGGTKLVSPLEENAITAIKEALAQPSDSVEQEPVAWITQAGTLAQAGMTNLKTGLLYGWKPLYTTPPKRQPLVWLSEEEEQQIKHHCTTVACVLRAVKAKLKEKNT